MCDRRSRSVLRYSKTSIKNNMEKANKLQLKVQKLDREAMYMGVF